MNQLNFSCGSDIREGWDNCDWQKDKGIIFCNANVFPYPFKANTYEYVLVKQCLYMFDSPRRCLEELHRICKNNAIIHIEVPHYTNKGAYTDLDTIHLFNDQSFIKFAEENCRVDQKKRFEIIELKMTPTFIGKYIPHFLRKYLSLCINGLYSQIHIDFKVIK